MRFRVCEVPLYGGNTARASPYTKRNFEAPCGEFLRCFEKKVALRSGPISWLCERTLFDFLHGLVAKKSSVSSENWKILLERI